MPKVTQSPRPRTVGVIGGGQLARMMAEAASELGVDLVVLAASADDAATSVASRIIVGQPSDRAALDELASSCDVVTLDHELVDLEALADLVHRGVKVYPSPDAVAFAARKDLQRQAMSRAGIAVPRFVVLDRDDGSGFDNFARELDTPPVVKAARGGYDGRGVLVSDDLAEARAFCAELVTATPVVLEERVTLLGEIAAVVVSGVNGERRFWPLVRTVQSSGMCAEVRFPSGFDSAIEAETRLLSERVADLVGAVGVLAIELFVTPDGVVLNEVATRPHNSGHWTIEGASTSQFENHLRAVLALPLGSTEPVAPAAVMVNVVGANAPGDLAAALAIPGAHVHDYGKSWRAGRKLGHVTVLGDDVAAARVSAWESAESLGVVATKESS